MSPAPWSYQTTAAPADLPECVFPSCSIYSHRPKKHVAGLVVVLVVATLRRQRRARGGYTLRWLPADPLLVLSKAELFRGKGPQESELAAKFCACVGFGEAGHVLREGGYVGSVPAVVSFQIIGQ